MFNTRRRRQGGQEEEVPEPGSDSTYGVRSLGDSDFGSGLIAGLTTHSDTENEATDERDSGVPMHTAQESTPTANTESLVDSDPLAEAETEPSPSSPIITSPRSPITPFPEQVEGYYRHTLIDDLSEPSSPASFASMPSYISSSLSRTSSLGPDGRIPYPMNYTGMGGSEELVMPTMNFVQGSTSKVEDRVGRGIKVVLLGEEDQMEGFVEELRGRKEVVELGNGKWTLGGDMAFTISTGSMEEVSPGSDRRPAGEKLIVDRDEIRQCLYDTQWGFTP
jgi:hypothetical protein